MLAVIHECRRPRGARAGGAVVGASGGPWPVRDESSPTNLDPRARWSHRDRVLTGRFSRGVSLPCSSVPAVSVLVLEHAGS